MGRHHQNAAATRRASASTCLLALFLLVATLVLSGCGSDALDPASAAAEHPRHGGTLWMETAQEPPTLNWLSASGGMSITDVLTGPMRSDWVIADDRGRWQPQLATEVPTEENGLVQRTDDGGMRIAFEIDPRAMWSDGVPITCADLRFTWRTIVDPDLAIGTRVGWELVREIRCPTVRSVRIELREPYAAYLANLLATSPLPEHELRDADFDRVWNNRITVSSGPFLFARWARGDRIELRRNPRWWRAGDADTPYLDRLITRFMPDANTLKLDLRMGDVDVIGLPADTNLPRELDAIPTAAHSIQPGAGWENLTFNTSRAPLSDARVRRAVAYTIDRDALVDVVLRKQVPRLDSTLLPTQDPYVAATFDRYRPDPDRVDALMRDAGWRLDRRGRWVDPRGSTAHLELVTSAGNPLRYKAIQLVAAQLDEAGFDAEIVIAKPEVMFSSLVAPGEFDIAMYSFTQGLDVSQTRFFACSEIARPPTWAGKNNAHLCNRELDRKLRQADRQLDVTARAATTHEIAETVASLLPLLPLYQQPDTLAWNRRVHGIRPNTMGGHTWNIDEWWIEE